MKRFMVIELSEEQYTRLMSDPRRITGSIGLLPDGETLDFHPHARPLVPQPRRRRLDIPCAGGTLTLYYPDASTN